MEDQGNLIDKSTDPVADPAPIKSILDHKPDPDAFIVAAIISLAIALFSTLEWNLAGAFEKLASSYNTVVVDQQYYRLFSAMFIHGDFKHLLSNLFYSSILIFLLMGYFGFFTIGIAAILFGALTNYLTILAMPADQYLLGFSGVVFWLGSTWLTLYFLLMKRYSLSQRILRTLGIALVIFFPSDAFDPSISYRAHLYGFVGGIFFAICLYFMRKKDLEVPIQPNPSNENQQQTSLP